MFYHLLRAILLIVMRPLWLEQIKGRENIPKKGPCIIAANHSSYLDFIGLMIASRRRITFLAAEKFYAHPVWRLVMIGTGQIRVDRGGGRGERAMRKAVRRLKRGWVIGIFPEGTRSPDGEIRKVYPGVAKMALETGAPVIPVGIRGAHEVLSRDTPVPKFDKTYSIVIGEPILVEGESNVEALLDKIMDRIRYLANTTT